MKIIEYIVNIIEDIVMFIFIAFIILALTASLWLPWLLLILRG